MKPLIILLGTFATTLFAMHFFSDKPDPLLPGRVAMAVMLLFTAIAHFSFREGMVAMIPPPVPFKEELVLLTGIFEILGGIGLLVPSLARISAVLLITFFYRRASGQYLGRQKKDRLSIRKTGRLGSALSLVPGAASIALHRLDLVFCFRFAVRVSDHGPDVLTCCDELQIIKPG